MAFNPFDVFRRNQRILFAIITVFVMFTFVLSFGQGDFFSLVPQWLASRQQTGDVLATVDGGKITSSDLGDVEARRLLANQYMVAATGFAFDNLLATATEKTAAASADGKPALEEGVRAAGQNYFSRAMAQRVRTQEFAEKLRDREETIAQLRPALKGVLAAKAPTDADQTAALALLNGLDLAGRITVTRGGRPLYFSNQPDDISRDRLDFYLWLKKADQLGIQFSNADVVSLVNADLFKALSDDDFKKVDKALPQGTVAGAPDRLLGALADEFRVRAAQAAVVGRVAVDPQADAYGAPLDLLRFYREQTAPANFGLIAVPAESFVPQVPGAPSESTLQEIFRAGRNSDPSPFSGKVGLREPRKLKVGWLEVKGDEPFYKAAAAEAAVKLPVLAQLSGVFTVPVGGVSMATALTAVPTAMRPNLGTEKLYQNYVESHRNALASNWFTLVPFGQLPDTSLIRPAGVANLALNLTAGSPLGAAAAFAADGAAADRQARLRTLPSALLAPALPGPGTLAAAIGAIASLAPATEPLPESAVRGRLLEQVRERLQRDIAERDVKKFAEDLAKRNAKPDDAEARKAAAEFIASRGLKSGESAEFRDLYRIQGDPGLATLKDASKPDLIDPLPTIFEAARFGAAFFADTEAAPGRRGAAPGGFFSPKPFPPVQSQFGMPPPALGLIAWRTAEKPAEAPRNLADPEAKAKTLAAWRRTQAREIARKTAEEFTAKAGALGSTPVEVRQKFLDLQKQVRDRVTDPAQREKVAFTEVDNVAPLVVSNQTLAMPGRSQAQPFLFPQSNAVPFPTRKMQEALLAAKDKPLSTSLTLADEPGDTYYIAVLLSRAEAGVDRFITTVYGSATQQSEFARPVLKRHQAELRRQAREAAVALLRAEFGYGQESDKLDGRTDEN